jgi:integrase
MAVILTDPVIKNSKPKSKEYTQREKGGFGIRIMPSGRKVFFYLYRVDGKRRFLNLGTYKVQREYPDGITLAEARKEYEAERARVNALKAGRAEGADPVEVRREKKSQREERRKAHTVEELVKEYLERHAKRFKRSWAKDEQILNRDIIPLWGNRKAADVTKRDVISLLEGIVERGAPAMANNTFQIVRKMFNYAVEKDILQHTPCTGVKPPAEGHHRGRTLSEEEIKTLWTNLDRTDLNMSHDSRRALKLILITAQRPGEVAGMHSVEIDGHWWTIPVSRQKVAKAKEHKRAPHRVYLTDLALELIGPLEVTDAETGESKPKGFIFPTPLKKKEQSIGDTALAVTVGRNLAHPMTDSKGNPLFTEDGKPATENRLGIEHFTPHDLRRTAATLMAASGAMDEVIDAVLNHVKQGIVRVYNQYRYDPEKQLALESWERKLKNILHSGGTNNVVSINSRKSSV